MSEKGHGAKGMGERRADELGVGADIHILPHMKQLARGTCCKAKGVQLSASCGDSGGMGVLSRGWDGGL